MTKTADIDFIYLDDSVRVVFAKDRGGLAGFFGVSVAIGAGGEGFVFFWVGGWVNAVNVRLMHNPGRLIK